MAKPEFCPALSSLEIHDEETGEMNPPKKVKCKGGTCPLFRKKSQSCALEEVATARPATEVVATPQPVLDEVALMRRIDEGISGAFRQMSALVADVTVKNEAGLQKMEASLDEHSGFLGEIVKGIRRLSSSGGALERLRGELDRKLKKVANEEEARELVEEGRAHLMAGRASDAVRALRKCVGLGDAAPEGAHAALGAALVRAGDVAAGAELLEKAAAEHPEFATPLANLAHARALAGDWEAAEETARRAVEIDPTCAAAWNTLGNACFAGGRPPEAIQCWQRAVKARPGLRAAWENLERQLGTSEMEESLAS